MPAGLKDRIRECASGLKEYAKQIKQLEAAREQDRARIAQLEQQVSVLAGTAAGALASGGVAVSAEAGFGAWLAHFSLYGAHAVCLQHTYTECLRGRHAMSL